MRKQTTALPWSATPPRSHAVPPLAVIPAGNLLLVRFHLRPKFPEQPDSRLNHTRTRCSLISRPPGRGERPEWVRLVEQLFQPFDQGGDQVKAAPEHDVDSNALTRSIECLRSCGRSGASCFNRRRPGCRSNLGLIPAFRSGQHRSTPTARTPSPTLPPNFGYPMLAKLAWASFAEVNDGTPRGATPFAASGPASEIRSAQILSL